MDLQALKNRFSIIGNTPALNHALNTAEQVAATDLTVLIVGESGVPFGLKWFGHGEDTVLPTVLLINQHGRIVYSDQTSNYRVRPEPDQFLEVARQKLRGAEG